MWYFYGIGLFHFAQYLLYSLVYALQMTGLHCFYGQAVFHSASAPYLCVDSPWVDPFALVNIGSNSRVQMAL